jgi:hypothetical protein
MSDRDIETAQKDVQADAWSGIKADLKVTVMANDVLVAEATHPILWAQVLRLIGDFKP